MPTLDDLIALNDELAALAGAGLPLELGFRSGEKGRRDALTRINDTVARRVHRGETVEEALRDDESFPPIYQHVMQAGLRCGRLPAALEGLTRHAQGQLEVRQSLASAFVYPLILCVLAYVLFVGFCRYLAPTLEQTYATLEVAPRWGMQLVELAGDWLPIWIGLPPLALFVGCYSWRWSDRNAVMGFRGLMRPLNWLPPVSRIAHDHRCATLAEVLALLVSNGVPWREGLPLAAGVTGDPRLQQAADALATAADKKNPIDATMPGRRELPPFLGWALTQNRDEAGVAESLRLAANTYRLRAQRRTERIRVVLPILACTLVGGGVTLLYALSLFLPLVQMLQGLASSG
jgi:general secretion pathway protein F